MLVTVIPQLSQAGIALGAALVASDAARRHQALAATRQALFGKTEPALYGFTLAVPHLQAAANVASGLAAAAAIALGGTFYGVTGGVLGILGTVGPEGAGAPTVAYLAASAVALICAGVSAAVAFRMRRGVSK